MKGQTVELSTETGFLLPSDDKTSNEILRQSFYRAETLRLFFDADTTKTYAKLYRGPSYGIGVYSGTFYNKNIGDPLALFFFIKTPIYRTSSLNMFSEIGTGIAGNFKPYHETLNPKNAMIGSRINMFGHFAIGFEYFITQPIKLGVTVGYTHFSNGFIKAPNYGINVIPVTLSCGYNFSKNRPAASTAGIEPFKPHHRFSIFVAPSTKNFNYNEKNYFVSTLGLYYIRQVGYKIGVGGGLDVFYKDSGKDKVMSNESDFSKSTSAGVNASLEWVFTEKFRMNLGLGTYVLRHKENDEAFPFYERIVAKYNLTKNIFTGVGVKVNKNASDYIEWTIGYVWAKDQNTYQLK